MFVFCFKYTFLCRFAGNGEKFYINLHFGEMFVLFYIAGTSGHGTPLRNGGRIRGVSIYQSKCEAMITWYFSMPTTEMFSTLFRIIRTVPSTSTLSGRREGINDDDYNYDNVYDMYSLPYFQFTVL